MSMPAPKPRRVLKRKPFQDRFWSFVPEGSADECWEWQGKRQKQIRNGRDWDYGIFTIPEPGGDPRKTKQVRAHRIAWELANQQPLGPDDAVLHSCDNPPCVNPAHLMRGTQSDNVADMTAKSRHHDHGRTHCVNGHDRRLPGATRLRKRPAGGHDIVCVACAREATRRWKARSRAA